MAGYNAEQLGAGGGAEDGGVAEGPCPDPKRLEYDRVMLQTALEDFDRNFKEE